MKKGTYLIISMLLALIVLWAASSAEALLSEVYVSPSGSDSNDGSTAATPKLTVQNAVGALDPASNGRIYIASGNYPDGVVIDRGCNLFPSAGVTIGALTISSVGAITDIASDLTVNGSVTVSNGSTLALLTPGTLLTIDGNLDIGISAVFDLNGANLTISGIFSNNGTFRCKGTETIAGLTQDTNSGIWEYTGDTSAAPIVIKDFGAAVDYYDLKINDNSGPGYTISAPLSVAHNLDISFGGLDLSPDTVAVGGNVTVVSHGTLTAPDSASGFTIGGNYTNDGGIFNHSDGTVTFNAGGPQSLDPGGTGSDKDFYNIIHSGTGTLDLAGNPLGIASDLTNENGTFNTNEQNVSIGANLTLTAGNIRVGSDAVTMTVNGMTNIDGGVMTVTGTSSTLKTNDGTLTINNGGSLNALAGNLIVKDLAINNTATLLAPGTGKSFSIAGDFTNSAGAAAFLHGYGTVLFNKASAGIQALDSGGVSFYNLTHDGAGTLLLASDIDILGDLSNTTGTFDAADKIITLAGNFSNAAAAVFEAGPDIFMSNDIPKEWSNTGTFNHHDGTVTLSGTAGIDAAVSISGNTTFKNLICNTNGKVLLFASGSTQTIAGALTLTGKSGSLVKLNSTLAGNAYTLDVSGPDATANVSYVNVQDSTARNLIIPTASVNSGNNTNWLFDTGINQPFESSGDIVVKPYAGSQTALDPGPGIYFSCIFPDISPDGTEIVFGGSGKLRKMNISTKAVTELANIDPGKVILTCRYSPDGGKIAFWVAGSALRQIFYVMADGGDIPNEPPGTKIKCLWAQQASQGRSNLAWAYEDGAYDKIYFLNFEYLNNGKFSRAIQKVNLSGAVETVLDDLSNAALLDNANLLDFDVAYDSIYGDIPVIMRTNGTSSLLTTYNGMDFNNLSQINVSSNLIAWSGYAPEGARPVWFKEGGAWRIGYNRGDGSIVSRGNTMDAAEISMSLTGCFPRWNTAGKMVYRRPHTQ